MASDPQVERVRLVIEPRDNEPGATDMGGDRANPAGPEDMIDLGRLEESQPEYDFEDEEESSGRRRLLPIGLAALALAGFGAITWYAYQSVLGGGDEMIPLIQADAGPIKTRPATPGGMEVPYRDKLVLNQLSPDPDKPQVERLLPPQEVPKPPLVKDESLARNAPAISDETPAQAPAAAAPAVPAPKAPVAAPEIAAARSGKTGGDLAPAAGSNEATPATPAPAPKSSQAAAPPAPKPAAAERRTAKTTQTAAAALNYLVQLAALKDKNTAGGEWNRLQKAFPNLLADKHLVLQEADLGSRGIYHRIRAGYFANRASAVAFCQAIKAKNQACIVVKP